MPTRILIAVFAMAVSGLASPARASVESDRFRFWSVADTFVDARTPGASFGSAETLKAKGVERHTLIKFRVDGLEERVVTAAHLALPQLSSSAERVRISKTSNKWSEATTWQSKPAVGRSLITFSPTSSSTHNVIPVDAKAISDSGRISFFITSEGGASSWSSRDGYSPPELILSVEREPGLMLDGLTQVAHERVGSSDPTYYSNQHHLAESSQGRLLAVHGRHAEGVQLAWRDPGGSWQTTTDGRVGDGLLKAGTGTGDWPASIATGRDSRGREHAWVLWAAPSIGTIPKTVVQMSRLSKLNAALGPTIGPIVTLVSDNQPESSEGAARVDLAIEDPPNGDPQAIVTWLSKEAGTYKQMTARLSTLDSAQPALIETDSLFSASASRGATLESRNGSTRLIVRNAAGQLQLFTRTAGSPITTWAAQTAGVTLPTSVAGFPTAGILDSGDTIVAVETDRNSHSVAIQRWNTNTGSVSTLQTMNGYSEPTLSTDGNNVHLIAVRTDDGSVISRHILGSGSAPTVDVVEVSPDEAPAASYPNALRYNEGRVSFVLRGALAGSTHSSVLAFQRRL